VPAPSARVIRKVRHRHPPEPAAPPILELIKALLSTLLRHATVVRAGAAFVIACALSFGARAGADDRVALVIGNSAYPSAPLANPAKDARAVASALRALGFQVVELIDASKSDMDRGVAQARERLRGLGGTGLLYYAGHAIQLDWHNYLVPVDARLAQPGDVPTQTVDIQSILAAFKVAGNRMNIIVLDACRDNPFGATGRSLGLAPLDAPPGTYMAYSTAPGNVAEDGALADGNSLFTAQFVLELQRPKSRIEEVFKRVRLQVRQRTEGRQIPWDSSSLEDEFFFDAGTRAPDPEDPKVRESEFALEKGEWDRISESQDATVFYAYLEKYPTGMIAALAQSRIDALQAPKIKPQRDPSGRPGDVWGEAINDGDRFWYYVSSGYTGMLTGHGFLRLEVRGDEVREVWGRGPAGVATVRATREGFIVQDESGVYDPPIPLVPGDVWQVGSTAKSRTMWKPPSGPAQWLDVELKVVSREPVTVTMGTFDAYKVVLSGLRQDGTRISRTSWFVPGWYAPLKWDQVVTPPRSSLGPDVTSREMSGRERGSP
jgi:hypothetical protein